MFLSRRTPRQRLVWTADNARRTFIMRADMRVCVRVQARRDIGGQDSLANRFAPVTDTHTHTHNGRM